MGTRVGSWPPTRPRRRRWARSFTGEASRLRRSASSPRQAVSPYTLRKYGAGGRRLASQLSIPPAEHLPSTLVCTRRRRVDPVSMARHIGLEANGGSMTEEREHRRLVSRPLLTDTDRADRTRPSQRRLP
jgi:hypothetical protein